MTYADRWLCRIQCNEILQNDVSLKDATLKTTERKDLNLKKKEKYSRLCLWLSSCILKFLYGLNEKRIHCLTFFAQEFLQTISSISLLFPHPSSSQYPRIFDKLISIIVFFSYSRVLIDGRVVGLLVGRYTLSPNVYVAHILIHLHLFTDGTILKHFPQEKNVPGKKCQLVHISFSLQ
jgi:hypothetical protein